jgi:hypothetical protein
MDESQGGPDRFYYSAALQVIHFDIKNKNGLSGPETRQAKVGLNRLTD